MTPFSAQWFGLVVCRSRPELPGVDYWAAAPVKAGWSIELAGAATPADFASEARSWLGLGDAPSVEMLAYRDARLGRYRFAAFDGDRLVGAVFVAREPVEASRSWAAEQLAIAAHGPADRFRVLAGRAGAETPDRGPTVCACFEIGRNQIADAVAKGGCSSVDAVGRVLKAGTNCGSCRAEIGSIGNARLAKAG